jgi:multisubunit Na+/H+ antiporter MnhB subunit
LFVLAVVILCLIKPNAGRIFLGLFFLVMAIGVNGSFTFSLSGSRHYGSHAHSEMEDENGTLALLGQFFVGIGLLLLGLAAIWFVSVYNEKKE